MRNTLTSVWLGIFLSYGYATTSPTTTTPTVSIAPSMIPTILNTSAPTRAPTTLQPTGNSTRPTTALPERSFVTDFDANVSVNGRDARMAYYVFMYMALILGPIFGLGYVMFRVTKPRTLISQVRVKSIYVHCLATGWYIWIVCAMIQFMAPLSSEAMIVELVLTVLSFIIVWVGLLCILVPMRNSLAELGEHSKFRCVNCQAVQIMHEEMGLSEPMINVVYDGKSLYSGTLSLPAIKNGFDSEVPPKDFSAIGTTKDHVVEELFSQAAIYWNGVGKFRTIRAQLLSEGQELVTAGSFSPIGMSIKGGAGGKKIPCSHELSLCIKQGIVSTTEEFSNKYSCADTDISPDCSFTVSQGVSDVKRALAANLVVLRTKVMDMGPISKTNVFHCGDMRSAIPYLLNGYESVNHRTL